jgi:hypothetical protein
LEKAILSISAIGDVYRGTCTYDIAHDSIEPLWFIKRLMPETIYCLFGWIYAKKKWRLKDGSGDASEMW